MADVEPAGHAFLCGTTVLVAGYGLAGRSAVRALVAGHAIVEVTSDGPVDASEVPSGVVVRGALDRLPDDPEYPGRPLPEILIVSPGLRPSHPLVLDALDRGVEVWGELELAWRLRGPDAARWLVLTGTNGKTTTVRMLESMLRAGGLRARAVGNVGVSIIDAVREGGDDVLAVEASSYQLHFSSSLHPLAGALLNLAPDHLDWHGSMAHYAAAKARVWRAATAIANADDAQVAELAPAGAVTFTLGEPHDGQLGVIDGDLVSRAFGDRGALLAPAADVRPAGAHNVANALAAAALARAAGVAPTAIGQGLRDFVPDPHRNQLVHSAGGVDWVDDSKATNPHAARASLTAYPSIVWVAGGQLKGVDPDELVREVAPRLRAAVLLGVDRALLHAALTRHAPKVPVIEVASTDDGAMTEAVAAAAGLARPGDAVLLAPAAASYDMFGGYAARGDAFATAARTVRP